MDKTDSLTLTTAAAKSQPVRRDLSAALGNPKLEKIYQAIVATTGDLSRENILQLRKDFKQP